MELLLVLRMYCEWLRFVSRIQFFSLQLFFSFLLFAVLGHTILAVHRFTLTPVVPHVETTKDWELQTIAYHKFLVGVELLPADLRQSNNGRGPRGSFLMKNHSVDNEPPTRMTRVTLTTLARVVIVISLVFVAAMVLFGDFLNTLQFNFVGLTGLLLQDGSVVTYSFISLGQSYPSSTGFADQAGPQMIMAMYFIFGVIMPVALVILMAILWFVPLTLVRQQQLIVLTEIANAWSAIDVFTLSVLVCLLQLPLVRPFPLPFTCPFRARV